MFVKAFRAERLSRLSLSILDLIRRAFGACGVKEGEYNDMWSVQQEKKKAGRNERECWE